MPTFQEALQDGMKMVQNCPRESRGRVSKHAGVLESLWVVSPSLFLGVNTET